MAPHKTQKKKKAARPASGNPRPSSEKKRPAPPPRRKMPVWLRNTLIGLIIFTLTLGVGIIFQYLVCALALGVAVFQLWYHRGRWLWTWACFLAVALYVLGVYLAMHYQPAWFFYFGAWIFVIVALVGEGSRAFRSAFGKSAD
jgi:hypothetical protein